MLNKNPPNINDFLFKMTEKKCKICSWLQFVATIHLYVQNLKFGWRLLEKFGMAAIEITIGYVFKI